MKEKINRFMQGRYGIDNYSKFLVATSLILVLLANITSFSVFTFLGLGTLIYAYIRVLSNKPAKRWRENQLYLQHKRKVLTRIKKLPNDVKQKKQYRFYRCPSCKQKVRVPRGKNKIRITCPSCRTQFVKKT
ncbi:zinc ribbon domain-containing protein [Desemzia incerta]|nr:zinc ribbon domain-containing protein [Desemzia incerta]